MSLVLSCFPGLDVLGMGFEAEGFTVVTGPDLIWGRDMRGWSVPRGRFDGIIGGPPCKEFSTARGGKAAVHGNLIPEFERVVAEARPRWWLMENVPRAPLPAIEGYETHAQLVNNRAFGEAQRRVRRISSNLRLSLPGVALECIDVEASATTSRWIGGRQYGCRTRADLERVMKAQGLPAELDLSHFTVSKAVEFVCNAVPLPMARALARAVRRATWAA